MELLFVFFAWLVSSFGGFALVNLPVAYYLLWLAENDKAKLRAEITELKRCLDISVAQCVELRIRVAEFELPFDFEKIAKGRG